MLTPGVYDSGFSARGAQARRARLTFDPNVFPVAVKERGSIFGFLRDLLMIAGGWALLIGVIVHPVAQIAGLIACAVAMLFIRD